MDINDMMARARRSETIVALENNNDRLRRELEEAKAEIARMRPVVEASRGWVFSSPRHHGNKEAVDLVGAVIDYNSDSAGKKGE